MRNKLETEAKLYVQSLIQSGEHELVWSYILEFENNDNPHEDRKQSTLEWKDISMVKCDASQAIVSRAEMLQNAGFRSKDSLHIACAIEAEAVLRREGMLALVDKLGRLDAERFITSIIREPFDYTEWQKSLYNDLSVIELSTKAQAYCESVN